MTISNFTKEGLFLGDKTNSRIGQVKDLTGNVYGELTVIGFAGRTTNLKQNKMCWVCKCSCGEVKTVRSQDLTGGGTTSCGHLNRENVAKRFEEARKKVGVEKRDGGKAIPGYGDYYVYADGEVYSNKSRRYLKSVTDSDGYKIVGLTSKGVRKLHKVHRLVAEAFIDNPDGKLEVHHINHHRDDNRVENLDWVTNKENTSEDKKWVENVPSISVFVDDIEYTSLRKAAIKLGTNHKSLSAAIKKGQSEYKGHSIKTKI